MIAWCRWLAFWVWCVCWTGISAQKSEATLQSKKRDGYGFLGSFMHDKSEFFLENFLVKP